MTSLAALYNEIKPDIERRLAEFSALWESGGDLEIFREMCFCVCTPQTNAHKGWAAASALFDSGLLEKAGVEQVAQTLRTYGVRFHNHKAASIVKNRAEFYPNTKEILDPILKKADAQEALCRRIAGWGMKEAAHFMRNIGFGGDVCILDRHILRQLAALGVINEIPASLTLGIYREIGGAMRRFAKEARIPLAALDLVFWYLETGELFK